MSCFSFYLLFYISENRRTAPLQTVEGEQAIIRGGGGRERG
jgi:hypothetical protein